MLDNFKNTVRKRLGRFINTDNDLMYRLSGIFILTGIFLSITAIIIEFTLQQPLWMVFPSFIILIICLLIPVLADNLEKPIIVLILLVAFVYIPFLYFTNGGNDGVVMILFILILFYEAFYLNGKMLKIIISATIIFYSLLVIYGHYHPQYIMRYNSSFDKFIVSLLVLDSVAIVVSIVAISVFKGYRYEHMKSVRLSQELEKQNKSLVELSIRDQLTGVYNRRHFISILNSELEYFKTYKQHFYLLMIDIDDFKQINDKHGHLFGDDVLRKVAQQLVISTREHDIIARYGGEEFVAVISHLNPDDSLTISERIRSNISKLDLRYNAKVTVSIGITSNIESDSIEEVIERADKMLYKAKHSGKNCVIQYK